MTQLNKHSITALNVLERTFTKFTLRKMLMTSLAIASLSITGCSEAQQEQATQTLGLDEKEVLSLQVGSCFDDPSNTTTDSQENELITDVPIRDCDKPHDNEVFHLFDLPDVSTVSNEEALGEIIFSECDKAYEAYIGKSYEEFEDKATYTYLMPNDEALAEGDRDVFCYLYHPNEEPLTSSLKGSGL